MMKKAFVISSVAAFDFLACTVDKTGERTFINSADEEFFEAFYRVGQPAMENRPELASKFTCHSVEKLHDELFNAHLKCTVCEGTEWLKVSDIAACGKATDMESWKKINDELKGGCTFKWNPTYIDMPDGGTLNECQSLDRSFGPSGYGPPERLAARCRMQGDDKFEADQVRIKKEADQEAEELRKKVEAVEAKEITDVNAITVEMNALKKAFPESSPLVLVEEASEVVQAVEVGSDAPYPGGGAGSCCCYNKRSNKLAYSKRVGDHDCEYGRAGVSDGNHCVPLATSRDGTHCAKVFPSLAGEMIV